MSTFFHHQYNFHPFPDLIRFSNINIRSESPSLTQPLLGSFETSLGEKERGREGERVCGRLRGRSLLSLSLSFYLCVTEQNEMEGGSSRWLSPGSPVRSASQPAFCLSLEKSTFQFSPLSCSESTCPPHSAQRAGTGTDSQKRCHCGLTR